MVPQSWGQGPSSADACEWIFNVIWSSCFSICTAPLTLRYSTEHHSISSSSSSSTNFRATQVQKNFRAAVVSLSFRCGYGRWRALPNDLTNSSVFRARLELWTVGRDVIAVGNEFQTFAAAIGNARSPIVLCNERGTCSVDVEPECS